MGALVDFAIERVTFETVSGTTAPVVSQDTGHFIPRWDLDGTSVESLTPSVATGVGVGWYELPAWETVKLSTLSLNIDVSTLKGVAKLDVLGGNAYGDVTGLNSFTEIQVANNTSVFGSISGKPLTRLVVLNNTVMTGTITGMPLTLLRVVGNANIDGTINGMPLTILNVSSNALITGTITGMPIAQLTIGENDQIDGSFSGMNLNVLTVRNAAQVAGDLAGMTLTLLWIESAPLVTWSAPPTMRPTASRQMIIKQAVTVQMIDWALEGAAGVTSWSSQKEVVLTDASPTPSAAGLAFIPTITAAGATVVTN